MSDPAYDISREAARIRRGQLTKLEWHRYEVTAEYFASMAQLATDYWGLVCACRDHGPPLSGDAKLALAEFQRKIEDSHYETFGTRLILPEDAESRTEGGETETKPENKTNDHKRSRQVPREK